MKPSDKEKKKAWQREQREIARSRFPLAESLLSELFDCLDERLGESGCDGTNRFTLEWIRSNGHPEDEVINWVQDNGGYCDCEVLGNTADQFEQNRRDG